MRSQEDSGLEAEMKPAGRFAILFHDHPLPHWDFLLECGTVCRTWRLLADPFTNQVVPAEAIADHRLFYLDYSGPVSGNRGTVTQCDAGTYSRLKSPVADQAVAVQLTGQHIRADAFWKASESLWHFHIDEISASRGVDSLPLT